MTSYNIAKRHHFTHIWTASLDQEGKLGIIELV